MFSPRPGVLVGGRYELERLIGRGGTGEVWRANDRQLDTPCAVRFILGAAASEGHLPGRCEREAKIVARLRSPRSVQVLGYGEYEHAPFLAMELLEGETLRRRLLRLGKLDPATTYEVVAQIAQVLDKGHEVGVIHRDLKPENIWLSAELFVKVLDFGVAEPSGSLDAASGVSSGTLLCVAPEQPKEREIDHRVDLWALGVVTLECLTGTSPVESDDLGDGSMKLLARRSSALGSLVPGLPAGLQSWCERALALDPQAGFKSAAELVAALRPQLVSMPTRTPSPTPLSGSPPLPRPEPIGLGSPPAQDRRRALHRSAVAAAALLALAAIAASAWNRASRSEPPGAVAPKPPPLQGADVPRSATAGSATARPVAASGESQPAALPPEAAAAPVVVPIIVPEPRRGVAVAPATTPGRAPPKRPKAAAPRPDTAPVENSPAPREGAAPSTTRAPTNYGF